MTSRGGRRQEQRDLARSLRAQGLGWSGVARVLRSRYALGARVAMRMAHGWSQADAAAAWNRRWPDDPKSFKNISYWETWPSPTGHAPSLAVLDRLAQVYECDVADLVAGWGEHSAPARAAAPAPLGPEPDALARQVAHLDLPELTRAVADWAQRLPGPQRRALLLKLGTAVAVAAGRGDEPAPRPIGPGPGPGATPAALTGAWDSLYTYSSTSRDTELESRHRVHLRLDRGRLVGRSEPGAVGSVELDLRADGLLVSGAWTERTAREGHYRGAIYHGVLQLVLDPTGRSMTGRWLGPDKHLAVGTGTWTLVRSG